MSIENKLTLRNQSGVVDGEDKKSCGSAKTMGEVNIDDLTHDIEKISTVSGADIRAVLHSLVDVAADELANINIVQLDDLESLRVSIRSNGYDIASDANGNVIKGSKVLCFSYPAKS